MFVGTTPLEVRIVLKEMLKDYKGDIFVGCSGNFSTDKLLASMGFNVFSNDVSLYTKLISDILLGRDTEITVLNKDLQQTFEKWETESPYKKLIQVMFAMKIAGFSKQKNDYEREFYRNYIEKSETYYANTLAGFEKNKTFDFKISDFFFGDFVEFLSEKKGKGVGVSFPPTYRLGYERMFSFIEDAFDYKRAQYEIFDPKKSVETFGALLDYDENIIYSDRRWPQLEKYLAAKTVLKGGKHTVYLYSSLNRDKSYFIEDTKAKGAPNISILPLDYQITDKSEVSVVAVKAAEVNYFKKFYMSSRVNYSEGGDLGLIFCLDGKAFGFASFGLRMSNMHDLFMTSDFVVNSQIAKLSKLLIMLLKSKEVRSLLSKKLKNYYVGLKTSVYTDKPISMKYRGVFDLERRDKGKLIYRADFEERTISEIFKEFYKKYHSEGK